MMKDSLLSVVVPVYNVEQYLNTCVDSILNQTYENIEVILVDDGSSDNSGSICDAYAEKDERIKVIHKSNGGLSDARNCGIDAASGEYIIFVDSDDYIHSQMFEILIGQVIANDSDIAACEYQKVPEGTATVEMRAEAEVKILSGVKLLEELYSGNYSDISFISVCKLYKKSLFFDDDIRFPIGRYYEDMFTTHKLLYKARRVVIISEKLYFYRVRQGSIMHSDFTKKKIIDGICGDAENIKTFDGETDSNLLKLAYKTFCHSQYWHYRKVVQSDDSKDNKDEFRKILHEGFARVYREYNNRVRLSLKYRLANFAFLHFPDLFVKLVK